MFELGSLIFFSSDKEHLEWNSETILKHQIQVVSANFALLKRGCLKTEADRFWKCHCRQGFIFPIPLLSTRRIKVITTLANFHSTYDRSSWITEQIPSTPPPSFSLEHLDLTLPVSVAFLSGKKRGERKERQISGRLTQYAQVFPAGFLLSALNFSFFRFFLSLFPFFFLLSLFFS